MKAILTALVILALAAAPVMGADGTAAQAAIDKAKADIASLAESGISTFAVNDLLKEAEKQFNGGKYETAASLAAQISGLKESAMRADALMEQADLNLKELEKAGADTAEIRKSLDAARAAFLRDDFKTAETLSLATAGKIEEAQAKLNLEKTIITAQGFNLRTFVAAYWKELIIAIAAAAAAGRYGWKRYAKESAERKRARLEEKTENITKLMKELQEKHFLRGETSGTEYDTAMKNYQEQLADANRRLKMLKTRRGVKNAKTD